MFRQTLRRMSAAPGHGKIPGCPAIAKLSFRRLYALRQIWEREAS